MSSASCAVNRTGFDVFRTMASNWWTKLVTRLASDAIPMDMQKSMLARRSQSRASRPTSALALGRCRPVSASRALGQSDPVP